MLTTKFLISWSLLLARCSAFHMFKSSTRILTSKSSIDMSNNGNLVIISPPGGIGEVAAVKAAKLGSSVRWFVISPTESMTSVNLSGPTMDAISGSGSVELAGSQANTLLLPPDDSDSAISALKSWCGSAGGLICTFDGVYESINDLSNIPGTKPMENSEKSRIELEMINAIKVAAREASSSCTGVRVAIMSAKTEDKEETSTEENKTGIFESLLGRYKVNIPGSLNAAIGPNNMAILRHGDLFGIPESSPNSSPFLGGPRKLPVLQDEYTLKSVRIDPTISISGNTMMGDSTRSSRLAVGDAAVRIAINSIPIFDGIDVCLTSLAGTEEPDEEDWISEFTRVEKSMSLGVGAELFNAAFGSVRSVELLADWIATKWAPAVLKTYDIAGIRVGARPVYASRSGEGKVDIVWQELKNFETSVVGKMHIEVSEKGISASRGPGDASAGYALVSKVPLAGEDVLVRRLSDAATQAIEKGLATKPATPKRQKNKKKVAQVVSTFVDSSEVSPPSSEKSETGPRISGARRSSKRNRGSQN